MAWTTIGDGITTSDGSGGVLTTSTSTVLAVDSGGETILRMFGVNGKQVQQDPNSSAQPRPGWGVCQGPPPSYAGLVELGDLAVLDNIGFVESNLDLDFVLDPPAAGVYPVTSTVIPAAKSHKPLRLARGGTATVEDCSVRYQDACVVALPDGAGWLMLLARYARADSDGPSNPTGPVNAQSSAAIVGYWAPADDPTFTGGDVVGPFWLVSRVHALNGQQIPLWLGVPGGVVVDDDGIATLFLYYVAETSLYPEDDEQAAISAGFDAGVRLRKIAVEDILALLTWEAPRYDLQTGVILRDVSGPQLQSLTASRAIGRWLETDDDRAWFQETNWDEETGVYLVPGVEMGKVRIWVATGYEFTRGSDPSRDPQGNTPFEAQYYSVRTADPMPTLSAGEGLVGAEVLALYFAAILPGANSTSSLASWGVWRGAARAAAGHSRLWN